METLQKPDAPSAEAILYDSRDPARAHAPEATLIIPVYNVAAYLAECLASVFTNAATVDLEIIIIDDGSTDASGQRVADLLASRQPPQTLYLRQANQGLSAVRNRGVSLASGQYLGFLDSDDLLTAGAMRLLLDFARQNNCEVVLGKSLVFDSKNHHVWPFYDDWAWGRLLEGQGMRTRVVSRHEDPALFFLEPNANYRLVRRDFYSQNQLSYPVGRLFEDPPVHYLMLAKAARVGLVAVPYYWYRVNRPGKITAERSQRRFDILEVARETFTGLGRTDITANAGGAILYGLSRIVWWCGTMTLPEQRAEFFSKACAIFAEHAPPAWVAGFDSLRFPGEFQHLIVGALLHNEAGWLVQFSYHRRQPLKSLVFLLRIGRRDLVIRRLREMTHAYLARFRRR